MIVVSDTSPLTALLTIGRENLLLELFEQVAIPEAVRTELLRAHTRIPDWIRVHAVGNREEAARFAEFVDFGEAEAIELARELKADLLLIDERKGRRLAKAQGLAIIGLVGVVLLAKRRGLVESARRLLAELESGAGVYLAAELREEALKTVNE